MNNLILKQFLARLTAIILVSTILPGCEKERMFENMTIITAAGDIHSKLNEFRQTLGTQLNTTPGAIGGRREINWDGVATDQLNQPLPGNFFNTPGANISPARQKGLVYSAGINNFQVSSDGFKHINAAAAESFAAFSGSHTFASVGSNLWEIGFQVPGQPVDATIRGFGLVFSDVDLPTSTFIEFFNGNKSLGKFHAPVHDANGNLSFLGVYFNKEKVSRVVVHHQGNLAEGGQDVSAGGQKDLVVFDDFLFDEPVKNN